MSRKVQLLQRGLTAIVVGELNHSNGVTLLVTAGEFEKLTSRAQPSCVTLEELPFQSSNISDFDQWTVDRDYEWSIDKDPQGFHIGFAEDQIATEFALRWC